MGNLALPESFLTKTEPAVQGAAGSPTISNNHHLLLQADILCCTLFGCHDSDEFNIQPGVQFLMIVRLDPTPQLGLI